jgi:hypothetical protein
VNRIGRYVVIVGALLAVLTPSAVARILSQDSAAPPQQGNSPQVVTAPTLVSYQGRVTVNGVPHDGTGYFKFAVVNAAGTNSFWSNDGTSTTGNPPSANVPLSVSAGLFNVLLGDTSLSGMTQALNASVFNASARYLRVWFATTPGGPYTQLAPDRRIGSTPYALNAETLDGQDSSAFASASHDHFGQTWTGSITTGLTLNNSGATGLVASGSSTGVYGLSNTAASNDGVYGSAGGAGIDRGMYGTSDNTGVYGNATGASGTGVYGNSNATAVYGTVVDTSGVNYALYGSASNTGATDYGVYATSDDTGVYGLADATSGVTYGVWGASWSTLGRGVYGLATATSNVNYGVFGESASTAGRGVEGYASATSGQTYGVYGISTSPSGTGVYGCCSNIGVYGGGVAVGLYGYAFCTTCNYGVYSYGSTGATGTKAAIVETEDYGWRHLYAMESPNVWFEDFGQAQLVAGKATVAIEPVFAQTVNLEQSYMVFLTPLGDCAMYVAEQTPTTFSVRAMGGQTCEAGFYYRIIAKRLGYEDLRLGPAQDPATMMPAALPDEAPQDVRGR